MSDTIKPAPSVPSTAASDWLEVARVFDAALELHALQRRPFVERSCDGRPRIRDEVLRMLAETDGREGVLDRPAIHAIEGVAATAGDDLDRRIGPWRLVALLGRGGMGEVYRAQRIDGALTQEVAVKLLNTEAVSHISRFLDERRILARLSHPGIASLLDAGLTDDGRPYMVMRLIDGIAIDRWCASHVATLSQRLALFRQVCAAVAYAHANLVVHRDLKPGNILVDADGTTHLLDFGIAKVLSNDGATQTQATPYTLAYAAPEQLTDGAITTATDVYALGMLLFELLTGQRPFSVDGAALALAVERILHEPAPRASDRAAVTAIPARALRGDLDAIVARALAKRPEDRYPSVDALDADLRRYTVGQPVQARRASTPYVLGRFILRNRWAVAGVVAVIVALAAGLAGTVWQARAAARERDIARTEAARSDAVRDYVMLMFREAGEEKGEHELTAKQVLERSAARLMQMPTTETIERQEIFQLLGELYLAIDDFEGAAPVFRHYLENTGASADPAVAAEIRHDLATAETRLGNLDRARELLAQAQAYWNTDPVRFRESLASSRVVESQLLRQAGAVDQAIATLRAALAERLAISGREHAETAYAMNALALALMEAGQPEEADRLLGEALSIMTALGKQDSAAALSMLSNRGVVAMHLGDPVRATPMFERAVELRRKLYGRSAALAALQHNLARILAKTGRTVEARPLLLEARDMAAQFSGAASPMVLTMDLSGAELDLALDDLAAAQDTLDRTRALLARELGEGHVLYARSEQVLARLQLRQQRWTEAATTIDRAQQRFAALGDAGKPYLLEMEALHAALAESSTRR